jgi:hypothetical protein
VGWIFQRRIFEGRDWMLSSIALRWLVDVLRELRVRRFGWILLSFCGWEMGEYVEKGGERGAYFSDTAASRSARLLSILKRSFSAREKERAIVLRAVNCNPPILELGDLRLGSVISRPFSVKFLVGHVEAVGR